MVVCLCCGLDGGGGKRQEGGLGCGELCEKEGRKAEKG